MDLAFRRALLACSLLAIAAPTGVEGQPRQSPATATQSVQSAPATAQTPIRDYIAAGWQTLSRSMTECKSVVDPKVTTVSILYLPAGLETPAAVTSMQQRCRVEVRHLPRPIHFLGEVRPSELPVEGLLYLPNRYVVPGGRFNEMYGWDSYFILLGLVHDRRDRELRCDLERQSHLLLHALAASVFELDDSRGV
jgi:neutral trehalase